MAHEAPLETHPLQRHIGRLTVAMNPWVSVGGEHFFPGPAVGFCRLQQGECVFGQFFVSTAILVQLKVTALADRILEFNLPLVR